MPKAFLIDPFAQTITEVDHPGGLQSIYALTQCDIIQGVYLDNGDCIYVDEEGLLRDIEQRFFTIDGFAQPIAGRGLVVGSSEDGETVAPKTTLSELKGMIGWVRPDLRLDRIDTISGEHFVASVPRFKTGKDDER
jgi:hypothetical protein